MKGYPINLVGQRFDRLLVVGLFGTTQSGRLWMCICDCGENVIKITTQLTRKGKVRGCYKCDCLERSNSCWMNRNGNCKGGKTRLYEIWKGMKYRCSSKKQNMYYRYGGRGISVCDEWKSSFHIFKDWALSHGYSDNLTIERIDNDGNYCPENCEWITKSENSKRSHINRLKKVT